MDGGIKENLKKKNQSKTQRTKHLLSCASLLWTGVQCAFWKPRRDLPRNDVFCSRIPNNRKTTEKLLFIPTNRYTHFEHPSMISCPSSAPFYNKDDLYTTSIRTPLYAPREVRRVLFTRKQNTRKPTWISFTAARGMEKYHTVNSVYVLYRTYIYVRCRYAIAMQAAK